ncbi:MAG: hypothetical protein V1662_00235 [Candidatus Omnitrophota bacterium]
MKTINILILFLIIFFVILQCTLIDTIKILDIKPDMLLILIVLLALHFGPLRSLYAGILAGIFIETTSAIPRGIAVTSYALGGLILGYMRKWIYPALFYSLCANFKNSFSRPPLKQRLLSEISITFVFSLIVYILLYFLLQICNIRDCSFFHAFICVILPASLYTALVSPIVFSFIITVLEVCKIT